MEKLANYQYLRVEVIKEIGKKNYKLPTVTILSISCVISS